MNLDSVSRHHPGEGVEHAGVVPYVEAYSELSDHLRSKNVITGSTVFSSKPGGGLESWAELDSPRKCWTCCWYSSSFSSMMRDVRHDSSQRKASWRLRSSASSFRKVASVSLEAASASRACMRSETRLVFARSPSHTFVCRRWWHKVILG